jgi:hypothetical protein
MRHYGENPNAAEVDHKELIARLSRYDAWALSLSSPTLRIILPMCPDNSRVAAWVKPFCSFKPNVNPAYAWEPVIFYGARKRTRTDKTVRDWVSANITLRTGCAGAKPPEFSWWLFDLLGMEPDDEFDDLYPGTGNVSLMWTEWKKQKRWLSAV